MRRLDRHTRDQITHEVSELRRRLGCWSGPPDLSAAYDLVGLAGPVDIFGHDDALLEYRAHRGEIQLVDSVEQNVGGMIDHVTREVFANLRLPEPRLKFVLAHELMHEVLGHCDMLRLDGFDSGPYRGVMEREASFAAVEFICPRDELRDFVQERAPLGRRPGLREIRSAADYYGLTLFTVLRHYVHESAVLPTAVVTLARSRRGGRSIRMKGFKSDSWVEQQLPTMPTDLALDVNEDAIGWRAELFLAGKRESSYLEDVVEHVGRRWGAAAEAATTYGSIHVLLQA